MRNLYPPNLTHPHFSRSIFLFLFFFIFFVIWSLYLICVVWFNPKTLTVYGMGLFYTFEQINYTILRPLFLLTNLACRINLCGKYFQKFII
ncbi:hypothetical protein V1514DRAFT_304212 [Lipomyces japonicus]|uniref:uncharacterized protein n=1 Tax=Lipomyces japonicus TaxID=56871 RepID=UPI0034CF7ACD